jgi:predicted DNA-binding protein (MmcQ/YjbR family)
MKKLDKKVLVAIDEICMALPGVTKRISWGFPNYRVGEKMFAASGTGHGGPHLCFKVSDTSAVTDSRFKLVSEVGSWKGYEDWYFYFFDPTQPDDWKALKHLTEVSWELIFAQLPKKKQDAILAPVQKKSSPGTKAKRTGTKKAAKPNRRPR